METWPPRRGVALQALRSNDPSEGGTKAVDLGNCMRRAMGANALPQVARPGTRRFLSGVLAGRGRRVAGLPGHAQRHLLPARNQGESLAERRGPLAEEGQQGLLIHSQGAEPTGQDGVGRGRQPPHGGVVTAQGPRRHPGRGGHVPDRGEEPVSRNEPEGLAPQSSGFPTTLRAVEERVQVEKTHRRRRREVRRSAAHKSAETRR